MPTYVPECIPVGFYYRRSAYLPAEPLECLRAYNPAELHAAMIAYLHACMLKYVLARIHVCMHSCLHFRMFASLSVMPACMHACIFAPLNVCLLANVQASLFACFRACSRAGLKRLSWPVRFLGCRTAGILVCLLVRLPNYMRVC